jgi:hypothetical protein
MPTIIYKNKEGKRLQGATTIMSQNVGWGKEGLLYWANQQGLEGRTLQESRDTATVPGTLAHAMIEGDLRGEDWREIVGLSFECSTEDISKAETAYLNYLDWRKQFDFEPLYIEKNLVSEKWQYGGCPDIIGKVRGKWAIVDWKTGKTYENLFAQLVAYRELAYENDLIPFVCPVEFHCLRIPKNEDTPSFHHSYWGSLPQEAWDVFESALKLAKAKDVLKKLL